MTDVLFFITYLFIFVLTLMDVIHQDFLCEITAVYSDKWENLFKTDL